MALSFIGKPISLISHSDVRYRGTLAGIDPGASTIQLSNVYSMGTESRRPPAEFIPPVQEPYQYIIFRASEVKDLAVDEPAATRRSVHDDPAVLGASAPAVNPNNYNNQTNQNNQFNAPQPSGPAAPQQQQQQTQQPTPPQQPTTYAQQAQSGRKPPQSTPQGAEKSPPQASTTAPQARRTNSVHTAAASLETVTRALGDLRVSNGRGGGSSARRGGGGPTEIKVPSTDFDFQSSNAKFDKTAFVPKKKKVDTSEDDEDEDTNPSDTEKEKEKEKLAYNPQKSFFDSLSSSAHASPSGNHRGGGNGERGGERGGRGRGGRNRREEERERNVATFGEPGGVGLMGPGAYVGGWGGYGRRGGRPRRGATAVNVGSR